MRFQSETSVFKFLRRSVDGALHEYTITKGKGMAFECSFQIHEPDRKIIVKFHGSSHFDFFRSAVSDSWFVFCEAKKVTDLKRRLSCKISNLHVQVPFITPLRRYILNKKRHFNRILLRVYHYQQLFLGMSNELFCSKNCILLIFLLDIAQKALLINHWTCMIFEAQQARYINYVWPMD